MTALGDLPVALFGLGAGLGSGLARGLAERGAAMALLVDAIETDAAEEVAGTLRSAGHRVEVAAFDADDGMSVREALDRASAELGPIRAVVDVDPPGTAATAVPFRTVGKPSWDEQVTLPLHRMLHRFQAFHRTLAPNGGRVVVVFPTLSMSGAPGLVPWVAASEGRRAFAKVAARTWGADGITVNCLGVPASLLAGDPPPDRPFDRPGLPAAALGRLPEPRVEVAGTVASLLGRDMGFVTGTTLAVDGGVWMTP